MGRPYEMFRHAPVIIVLWIAACAPPGPRPYYSRDAGGWVAAPAAVNYTTTPPAEVAEVKPATASASQLRKVAESYLGVPYVFGGQSRDGMDCSGFVRQVFKEAMGLQLPHNASAISKFGRDVSKDELQPDDIIFFKGLFFIEHTGIYMGNGYFIHSQSSVGVNYTKLDAPYFAEHFAGAKRVVQ